MRRLACVGLLIVVATACSTGSHPAAPDLALRGGSPFGKPDWAKERKQFEQQAKDDPRNKYAWYNLGVVTEELHDPVTAESDYLRVIDLDPHFQAALYNYGVLRYNAADYHRAITYLRRAVAESSRDARAMWHLGLALKELHTKAGNGEAKHFLNEALKLNPDLGKTLVP